MTGADAIGGGAEGTSEAKVARVSGLAEECGLEGIGDSVEGTGDEAGLESGDGRVEKEAGVWDADFHLPGLSLMRRKS